MDLNRLSDLKKKIFFTIFILLIYRVGTFVPIPGVDADVVKNFFEGTAGNVFSMINLFSGGALERMSVFALNIMPYITASIIMQLASSIYKSLENLKKEGESGRAKINQYTRYLTIILAFFQSIGVYYALSSDGNNAFISDSKIFMLTTTVSLVGGTVILMWFGERITSSGFGNGISLIIFVGIISSLPSSMVQIFDLSRTGAYPIFVALLIFIFFVALLFFVCFIEKTIRKIKIQYPNANMMRASGMADSSFLPIKINMSGVIPPIFASSILMFPVALVQFTSVDGDLISSLLRRGGLLYMIIFSSLIMFFCYFYSSITFNSKDVAENLKKSNCFILGIRPGNDTATYIDKIISRLTFAGSLYLIFVCLFPEYFVTKYSIPFYIGGTGILIIVNVIMDLISQIQSHLIADKYTSGSTMKKRRVRIR
ncbi:preprotein translocase subunit SecY [Rickettsiales bacterium]|jgi:preprotein translocase subunit SecY|nr:preprotein translocase subunit SecY [Rickettsiales bacterium]